MSGVIDSESLVPKYCQLKAHLQKAIDDGQFKPGDRIPSEHEMARQYGIHRLTVRQALTHMVNEGVLCRFRGSGTYVADPLVALSKSRETLANPRIITLLLDSVRNIANPFFSAIARGLAEVLEDPGFDFQIAKTDIDMCELKHKHGVVIVDSLIPANRVIDIAERIPVVLVDREIEHPNISSVNADYYGGMYEATDYLIRLGHRNIVFMTDENLRWFKSQQMARGFQDALKAHDLPARDFLIEELPARDIEYLSMKVARIMRESVPTAFLCARDLLAYRLMKVLRDIGCDVPSQVSVVGSNDDQMSTLVSPDLTTFRVPVEDLGRESGKVLLAPREEGKMGVTKLLHTELIVRNSTVPPAVLHREQD